MVQKSPHNEIVLLRQNHCGVTHLAAEIKLKLNSEFFRFVIVI